MQHRFDFFLICIRRHDPALLPFWGLPCDCSTSKHLPPLFAICTFPLFVKKNVESCRVIMSRPLIADMWMNLFFGFFFVKSQETAQKTTPAGVFLGQMTGLWPLWGSKVKTLKKIQNFHFFLCWMGDGRIHLFPNSVSTSPCFLKYAVCHFHL